MDQLSRTEPELPSIAWDDLRSTLLRNRWLIAAIAVMVVVGAYASLQFVSWKYEASARVLVKLGRENTELPAAVLKGGLLTTGVRKEEINSEIQLLTSEDLIEQVVNDMGYERFMFAPKRPDNLFGLIKYYLKIAYRVFKSTVDDAAIALGLHPEYTDRQKVVMALQRNLQVVREKDSDVIGIRLRLPDPGLAVATVDKLLDDYVDRHISVRRHGNVKNFFSRQAEEYQLQLMAIEESRDTLRKQLGISDIGQQRALSLQRIDQLDKQRRKWAAERSRLPDADNATKPEIVERMNLPAVTADTLPIIQREIVERRLAMEKLLQSYGRDSRPARTLESEITALQAVMRQGLDTLIEENATQLRKEHGKLNQLDKGADKLLQLERERSLAETNYLAYAKRGEEAEVSEKMDLRRVSNIAILAPPVMPIKPVAPKKMLIMGLSLPVGLLIALGIVLLREYLNDRVRTARDLRALGGLEYLGRFRLTSD